VSLPTTYVYAECGYYLATFVVTHFTPESESSYVACCWTRTQGGDAKPARIRAGCITHPRVPIMIIMCSRVPRNCVATLRQKQQNHSLGIKVCLSEHMNCPPIKIICLYIESSSDIDIPSNHTWPPEIQQALCQLLCVSVKKSHQECSAARRFRCRSPLVRAATEKRLQKWRRPRPVMVLRRTVSSVGKAGPGISSSEVLWRDSDP
jgi:hypothetical protein